MATWRGNLIMASAAGVLALAGAGVAQGATNRDESLRPVTIRSSLDGTEQQAYFYVPPEAAPGARGRPVPLLVQLHTWSASYTQIHTRPRKQNWAVIAPDYRGPNVRPEACASALAIQDILDAVAFARTNANIDPSRIYLAGWSGGGHMALMMAAKAPQVWAGVSAWVPVTDLALWYTSGNYRESMEAACGGKPGTPATDAEFRARSPIHFLPAARGVPIDINAGIHDGHKGSVPINQSLNAFNVLAEANGFKDKCIAPADIDVMTRDEKVPPALAGETQNDPERKRAILFRRVAGAVRITLFEGGHEAEMGAAWSWLGRQQKGTPACFEVPKTKGGDGKSAGDVEQVGR